MTRRYQHLHDPNVSNDHFAEIADTDDDHYPTRAELAEEPDWPAPKAVAEPCAGDCVCLLCALQRHVRAWVA